MNSINSFVLVEDSTGKIQFVGVSKCESKEKVLVTQQSNGVHLYHIFDRKVLSSWILSSRSSFSCAAVQDVTNKRFFAALDGIHLHSWTRDFKEMIQTSPKFSFPNDRKIFKLLIDRFVQSSGVLVVLEDGSIFSFNANLKEESKNEELSSLSRSAVWSTVAKSPYGFRCLLLLHRKKDLRTQPNYQLDAFLLTEDQKISRLGGSEISCPTKGKDSILSTTLTDDFKLSLLWSTGDLQIIDLNQSFKDNTTENNEEEKTEVEKKEKKEKSIRLGNLQVQHSIILQNLVLPRASQTNRTVVSTALSQSNVLVVGNQSQDHSQRAVTTVDANFGVILSTTEVPALSQFHFNDVLSFPSSGIVIYVGTSSIIVSKQTVQSSSLADTLNAILASENEESVSYNPPSKGNHDLQKWIKMTLSGSSHNNIDEGSARRKEFQREIEESNRKEDELVESLLSSKSEKDLTEKMGSHEGSLSLFCLKSVVDFALEKKYFKVISNIIQNNQMQTTTPHPHLVEVLAESKKTLLLEELVNSQVDFGIQDIIFLLNYFTTEDRHQSKALIKLLNIPLSYSFHLKVAKSLSISNSMVLVEILENVISSTTLEEESAKEEKELEVKYAISWLNAILDSHFVEFVLNKETHSFVERIKDSSSKLLASLKNSEDLLGKLQVIIERNELPKDASAYSIKVFRFEDAKTLNQARGITK